MRPRLLLAPDSFKGTFRAEDVAAAMAAGAERGGCEPEECPLADGGEGTMDILLAQLGGELRSTTVLDPLGAPVEARFALLDGGGTAIVETAEASGLQLLTDRERDPERASTYGTGQLILAAARAGARRILVAAGGSATTDGGAGAIEAIEHGGGLGDASLVVLCDVKTRFGDASRVFAPQKGADAAAVERLTARLDLLAERLPRDPRGVPMTGCAGGLSGGLWARYDARLEPGAAAVLGAVDFDCRLRVAAAVLTGEGMLDAQSGDGKVVGEVARCGAALNVPVHAIVGRDSREPGRRQLDGLMSVTEAGTVQAIEAAAFRIATALATQERVKSAEVV